MFFTNTFYIPSKKIIRFKINCWLKLNLCNILFLNFFFIIHILIMKYSGNLI